MPTTTPTATTGATAQASPRVYVDPRRVVTAEQLGAPFAGTGLNGPFLADLLSAAITHERCGLHLYRSVAGRTHNPMLKRRYVAFGEETEQHIEVLESLVGRLGGDPQYVSPMARAVQAMDTKLVESTFLLAGSGDMMLMESVMLDAVLLAESTCHANWTALAALVPELPEGEVRAAFRGAVDEVGAQEDEHLGWARETRTEMLRLQVAHPVAARAGSAVEDVIGAIEGWFRDRS